MNTNPLTRIIPHPQSRVPRSSALLLALALAAGPSPALKAGDDTQPPAQPAAEAAAEKPAPLPLHQIEGNVVVFITGNFALAAEYKEQPRDYQAIGNLVKREGDWATMDAAYVVNKHLTLAAGYGHFGNVLNHEANGVWGITTKWEF